MVKFSSFALFSVSLFSTSSLVHSRPQFEDFLNDFSNQFVDIFGGVDINELIAQAEQGFQS